MRKDNRLKYLGLTLLLVLATINFTKTTLSIIKSSKRLDDIKGDISALEQQKADLQKSIDDKKSDEYIEKVAREELNMTKPGESIYVVKGLLGQNGAVEGDNATVVGNGVVKLTVSERVANLKLWWAWMF